MRRVVFDDRAAVRFRRSLGEGMRARWTRRQVGLAAAVGILGLVSHAAEMSGCFGHSEALPVRVVRAAVQVGTTESERLNMSVLRKGIVAVGVTMSTSALAADRLVPGAYPSIQSAVDAAADGDVIRLAAGTFTETCIVQGKALSFVGAGAGLTTWIAPKGQRCLWMPFVDTKAISVTGIHFAGFDMPYNAAAVDLESTGAHRISQCRFSNSGYFALELFGRDSVVEDCAFVSNTGSALSLTVPQGTPSGLQTVRRCRFENNWQSDGQAAAIEVYLCAVRVEECDFKANNWPAGNGRAVRVQGTLELANSRFCESGPKPIAGPWTDAGGNQFSTQPCAIECPSDLVADSTVNAADMAIVLNFWGTDGSQFPGVDIDGDGIVNGADLAAVLNAWGPCPQ